MNTLFAAVASSAALSAGLLAQVTSVRMGPPDSAPTAPVQRPPTKPEDLCTLEGRVTNAITGEPLKKAAVTIDGREFKMPWAWYTTVSDETGRYAAKGLDPGHYRVSARRSGFLGTPQRGGPPPDGTERLITLTPGQRAADADLKLTPQGVVTGRVINREGEPMTGYVVTPCVFQYVGGRRVLVEATGSPETDDAGDYRIRPLPPGRYYILVKKQPYRGGPDSEQDRSATPRQEDYVATYYPGTADPAGAVPVEVAAGQTASGVNITLVRAHVTRVRGRLVNQTAARVSLALRPAGIAEMWGAQVNPGPQGEFEFSGIAPGQYVLEASALLEQNRMHRVVQPVAVGQEPLEDLNIVFTRPYEISGTLKVEGGKDLDLRTLKVALRAPWRDASYPNARISEMMGHATPSVSPDEKGAFRLTQVSPQLYFVAIQNLPEGFYIKSVRMGEAEALENGVDLMRGAPAPLEIVLSPAAAAITGSVKSVKNDADAAAAGATVVLVPREDARRKQPLFYRSVKTDASGNFTLTGLSPGDYKLYAWMQVETDAWVDSEFLNPLEGKAQPVRLKEGAFEKAELRVIPAER